MKSYDELKSEMDQLEDQMVETKNRDRSESLKKVKDLRKEFVFTTGIMKGSLAEGRRQK